MMIHSFLDGLWYVWILDDVFDDGCRYLSPVARVARTAHVYQVRVLILYRNIVSNIDYATIHLPV